MNRNIIVGLLFLLLVGCVPDEPTTSNKTYNYTCVLVNMGNYSESNGSIALYNTSMGVVEQEVFSKANGRNIGSIIESVCLHDDILLLLCNNLDKLVFLDANTMREISAPLTDIGVPRYACARANTAYVSCWNKIDKQSGSIIIPEHIAKVNLNSKTVVAYLPVSGQPEGMALQGDTLFVASGSGLDVFNVKVDTLITHISSSFPLAQAQQVLIDNNNQLWLSLGSYDNSGGFMVVDANTLQVKQQLSEAKLSFEGDMALSPSKDKIYFIYADGIVGGQTAEVPTHIYSVNTDTYQVSSLPVISGVGFYGLGIDPNSGTIYTANVNGFITNSMTYLYNSSGSKIGEFMTGVGTSRFFFK